MGSSNVIAEAGLSIVNVLKKNMTPDPVASPESIGLCMPQEPEDFQITVWIYNIEEQRNTMNVMGFRPEPANPALERFAPMQLKLYLLISAHSKAPPQIRAANEYRIIGRAIQIIRDMPVVEASYLEGSLAGEGAALNLEILKLPAEEMSKIWNNSGKPIKMSFGLSVSVSLESTRVRPVATRVSEAQIDVQHK